MTTQVTYKIKDLNKSWDEIKPFTTTTIKKGTWWLDTEHVEYARELATECGYQVKVEYTNAEIPCRYIDPAGGGFYFAMSDMEIAERMATLIEALDEAIKNQSMSPQIKFLAKEGLDHEMKAARIILEARGTFKESCNL